MLPTFNLSGDILLLEHLSSRFEKIKPGDVVMARSPANPRLVVCKRVLGLEGDSVTVLPTSSRGHIRQVVVRVASAVFKASRCLLYYSEGYLTKIWISRFYERFWEAFIKVFILNQTLGVTYNDWQTVLTFLLKKMMGLSVSCGLLYNFPLESKSWF